MKRAKRNRFLFNAFVVRHVIGLGMLSYLVFSAFRLAPKIAMGSAAGLAAYVGVVVWMGIRLWKDICRQEGRL